MMMRRDVDPRWTEPEPVRLSDALTRFDGVDRRKTVPLPDEARPVSLRIPRNGQLVEWQPSAPAGAEQEAVGAFQD